MLPNRSLHLLFYGCLILVAAYLGLIGTTLYFASIRSSLAEEIREREASVAALETEYYDAIAKLSLEGYGAVGLTTPTTVEYVAAGGDVAVTRADN